MFPTVGKSLFVAAFVLVFAVGCGQYESSKILESSSSESSEFEPVKEPVDQPTDDPSPPVVTPPSPAPAPPSPAPSPAPQPPAPAPAPAPDQDGDGIPDLSDPCPTDPQNRCQQGTNISGSAELNTAISNARGGEVYLLAPGNYGQLDIKNKNYSSPVTFRAANPSNKPVFASMRITSSSNIVLDALMFDYVYAPGDKNSKSPNQASAVQQLTIMNCLFDGDEAYGTNSVVDGYATGRGLRIFGGNADITVINNEIRRFWKGVSIGDGSNFRFVGNDLHSIRSDGFNSGRADGLLVEKNYFHDFRGAPGSGDHKDMIQILRSSGQGSQNITIRSNIFDMAAGDYAQTVWSGSDGTGARLTNVLVENNIIYNAHTNGIAMHGVDGFTVRKNTMLRVPRSQTGGVSIPSVGSLGSTNVTITDNVIHGIAKQQSVWNVSNNILVQDTNPSAPGYFNNVFTIHAKSNPDGYNEFSPRPGGVIENARAGSDLMYLYPLGHGAATLNALRTLP